MKQGISSERTSRKQVPRTYRLVKEQLGGWKPGTRNLDLGCGRYPELFTEALAAEDVANYAYDPYWVPDQLAMDMAEQRIFDTVTVNNVLNVISDDQVRSEVIELAAQALHANGVAYFLIHEGNRSGAGYVTRDGWQENRRADEYKKQVLQFFSEVSRKENLLIARAPCNF